MHEIYQALRKLLIAARILWRVDLARIRDLIVRLIDWQRARYVSMADGTYDQPHVKAHSSMSSERAALIAKLRVEIEAPHHRDGPEKPTAIPIAPQSLAWLLRQAPTLITRGSEIEDQVDPLFIAAADEIERLCAEIVRLKGAAFPDEVADQADSLKVAEHLTR